MSVTDFITDFGYLGIFAVVFVESGLFLGLVLPLPGDTLLMTVGILAAGHVFDLETLLVVMTIAAVAGDTVGYITGYKSGEAVFKRSRSRFFHPENLSKAQRFFHNHGAKAVVFARFLPMVRTATPLLAGAGKMNYRKFLFFNIIGATLWVCSLTTISYYLGTKVPHLEKYVLWISVAGIGLGILLPLVVRYLRQKQER